MHITDVAVRNLEGHWHGRGVLCRGIRFGRSQVYTHVGIVQLQSVQRELPFGDDQFGAVQLQVSDERVDTYRRYHTIGMERSIVQKQLVHFDGNRQ